MESNDPSLWKCPANFPLKKSKRRPRLKKSFDFQFCVKQIEAVGNASVATVKDPSANFHAPPPPPPPQQPCGDGWVGVFVVGLWVKGLWALMCGVGADSIPPFLWSRALTRLQVRHVPWHEATRVTPNTQLMVFIRKPLSCITGIELNRIERNTVNTKGRKV